MSTRMKQWIAVTIATVLAAGVAGWVYRDSIGVLLAPAKKATVTRSADADEADDVFWRTFHGAAYDEIPRVLEVLTAAYLDTPTDAVTAAHIAWLRLIRFRGHLPKGGYDVPNGQRDAKPAAAPAV